MKKKPKRLSKVVDNVPTTSTAPFPAEFSIDRTREGARLEFDDLDLVLTAWGELKREQIRATVSASRKGEDQASAAPLYLNTMTLTNARDRNECAKGLLRKIVPPDLAPDAMGAVLDALERALRALEDTIRRDPAPEPSPTDAAVVFTGADAERSFHPAQDVVDGVLYFGRTAGNGEVVFLTSERQALNRSQLPAGLRPRHMDPGPGSISSGAARAWLEEGLRWSVATTLNELRDSFRKFVLFRDPRMAVLVAIWTFGTWVHRGFAVYPYLVVRSAEKRCGKSTLLDLVAVIAFNADAPEALPTAPNIYRAAEANAGTQVFDEVNLADGERAEAITAVFNVGYRRGGVVRRMEKRSDGTSKQCRFEVYAPRVLAGVATLNEMLEDRSIFMVMFRRRRSERIAPFRRAVVETEAAPLRDRCALAALSGIRGILAAYDTTADPVLAGVGVDDRAADLWQPLIAIAQVADAEDGGTRVADLLGLVQEQKRLRAAAEAEAGATVALVRALDTARKLFARNGENKDEVRIPPTELLRMLREPGMGFGWVESTKKLANLMKPLGFVAASTTVNEKKGVRAYTIRREDLAELLDRFAPPEEPEAESETVDVTTDLTNSGPPQRRTAVTTPR